MSTPYDPPATGKYTPTSWGGSPYTEMTMPSGQLCLVRKLQPIDLIAGDLLGGTDVLSQVVSQKVQEAKAGPQDHKKPKGEQEAAEAAKMADALEKVMSNPDNVESLIDNVLVKAVVEPRVELPPRDFVDRKNGVVYSDTVTFSDKMAIFSWVMGGLDNLKQFRGESAEDVADLEAGEGVQREAK